MNLSEPFIRRPVMTTLFITAVVFFGIVSYFSLPISDLPSVEFPTIQVSVSYPGASPETMSRTVAGPLERQFSAIEQVQSISSTSTTGSTTIVLQFSLDKNIDVAATDVQSKINSAMAYLPSDLPNDPTYTKVNPIATPIIWLAFSSNTIPTYEIYRNVDSIITRRLSMLSGVADIQTYGSAYAVRVQVDPDKMSANNLSFDDVSKMIASGNTDLPVGTLYGEKKDYNLRTNGELSNAKEYSNLIIRNQDGKMVRLKDIANVIDSRKSDKFDIMAYPSNETKQHSIIIGVRKQDNANTLKVLNEVYALLPTLLSEIPKSIQMHTIFDESDFIYESVHDLQLTLTIAFLLVALVTVFYLGKVVDSVIPIVVLPITLLGTLVVMLLMGYSLDILSLLSITLAIGFLVDDAIVVLENIVRHIEMGKSRLQAALDGSKQIAFTILSMTLCLATVFIPMLFMGGIIGRVFREFSSVIMVAVSISGVISLTLTPLLCSRFLSTKNEGAKNWLQKVSDGLNDFLLRVYKSALDVVLKHRFITLLSGLGIVVCTALLGIWIPKDFLPPDDLGLIQGFTQLEDSASPFESIRKQHQIAAIVKDDPNVELVVSAGGIPQENQGLFFVRLKPYQKRMPMAKVVWDLYGKLSQVVGAQIFLKPIPLIDLNVGTTASKGDYQYTLQNIHVDNFYEHATKFMERLKTIRGVEQVSSDMYVSASELNITIDRDKAAFYNLTATDVQKALMFAYGGTKITQINGISDQYNVILETLPEDYKDPSKLEKIYVGKDQVPLKQIVKMTEQVAPLAVNHFNTLPSVTLSFNIEGVPLSTALGQVAQAAKDTLPDGIAGTIQGTAEVFQKTFSKLFFLIFLTLFTIYVILGILYENFIHPITVMSALPPAAIGGFITLIIFGQTLSLYSFVGMMMLLGIVLKNGIILVDFAIEGIRNDGLSNEEAIYKACITRFRPIIMTTVAALMGAVPIALGIGGLTALSRIPLGLVIVGGLIFSQVLTLFLTPVVFIYAEKMRTFFNQRFLSPNTDHE